MQRHSVLSPTPSSRVEVVWVVLNPASYLYFSPDRKGPHCAESNSYKCKLPPSLYLSSSTRANPPFPPLKDGFENLHSALASYPPLPTQSPKWYFERFQGRRVHFIHGANDRGVGDDRPQAFAQG